MQKNRVLGDLISEMKEYDKANLSTVMVERMEKVITSSLAQKDQIIMAQRLAELEAEKRHQEEINKVREEQIKLMSQLMLLGAATGGGVGDQRPVQPGLSGQQREEVMA